MTNLFDEFGVNPNEESSTGNLFEEFGVPSKPKEEDFFSKIRSAQTKEFSNILGTDKIDFSQGAPAMLRLKTSFKETDEERVGTFKEYFPNGLLTRVTVPENVYSPIAGSDMLFFKENANDQEEPLKPFDESQVTFSDISDLAGALPEVIGGILPFLNPGVRAGGALYQGIASGLGAGAGKLAEESVEYLSGSQREKLSTVLFDAAKEAGITAGATVAMAPITKAINAASGSGLVKKSNAQAQIVQQMRNNPELGRLIDSTQVVDDGLKMTRILKGQASRVSPLFDQRINQANEVAARQLQDISSKALPGKIPGPHKSDEIGKKIIQEADRALRIMRDKANRLRGRGTIEETAQAAKTGLKSFVRDSQKQVSALYSKLDDVAEIEKPIFDISKAISKVNDIESSIGMATAHGEIPSGAAPLPNTLEQIITDIKKLSTEQIDYRGIKNIRSRLFKIMDGPGEWDINKRYAREIFSSLTDSIKNPVRFDGIGVVSGGKDITRRGSILTGPDSADLIDSPKFAEAFSKANDAARERFDLIADDFLQKIMHSTKPYDMGEEIVKRGGITPNLNKALSGYAPNELNQVQKGAMNFMINSSDKSAVETVDAFRRLNPEGFHRIAPTAAAKKELRLNARLHDELKSSRVAQLLDKQTQAGKFARELIKNQDYDGIEVMYRSLTPDGQRWLKAGIIQDLVDEATEITTAGRVINSKKLTEQLLEWDKSGVSEIILKGQGKQIVSQIKDINTLIETASKRAGSSAGLMTNEIAADIHKPTQAANAIRHLSVSKLIGHVIANRGTNLVLLGVGKETSPMNWLKMGSSSIAQFVNAQFQGEDNFNSVMREIMEFPTETERRALFSGNEELN